MTDPTPDALTPAQQVRRWAEGLLCLDLDCSFAAPCPCCQELEDRTARLLDKVKQEARQEQHEVTARACAKKCCKLRMTSEYSPYEAVAFAVKQCDLVAAAPPPKGPSSLERGLRRALKECIDNAPKGGQDHD